MQTSEMVQLIDEHLRSPGSSWNIGAFGALAEFHRDSSEHALAGEGAVVTGRGAIAIRLTPGCRAYAYELLSARTDCWLHGVALCLPQAEAGMSGRSHVTELGPDLGAVRAQDRRAVLFDLGLGIANCDFCVRTGDVALQAALREGARVPLLQNAALFDALVKASPHRVMLSRLGRIEVYQRIASREERSPEGPHTHLLPKLVRLQRTHPSTLPIPPGWVPCLSLYPPNPVLDDHGRPKAFDAAQHDAFQAVLERFAEPEFLAAKRSVADALRQGLLPPHSLPSRTQRTAYRVALRQARYGMPAARR